MGFTVERVGFISKSVMYNEIIKDLVGNGFTPIAYNEGNTSDAIPSITATRAVLEAGPAVDPLNSSQPWRIIVDSTIAGGRFIVGTPLQILEDGSCYSFSGVNVPATDVSIKRDICGLIGYDASDFGFTPDAYLHNASPYSYRLSITDRGFALECFQEVAFPNATGTLVRNFSFLCIQRLVNPITGKTQVEGRCPVVAMYSCDSGNVVKRIFVREVDVIAPTPSAIVSSYSDYTNQVINVSKQTVLAESNQYYIIFPSGFNTHRFLYNEEMDIVAYTSAGVLSQFNDALVNVYGRATIAFSNGSHEPSIDDVISGQNPGSPCSAIVYEIVLTSGNWSAGTAEGFLKVYNCIGTFDLGVSITNTTKSTTDIAVSTLDSQLEYRTYRGGSANIPDAEGMRMLYLVQGGGL